GDIVDLAPVHATLIVDHLEVSGGGDGACRIGRGRAAERRRRADLDFLVRGARAVFLLRGRRVRGDKSERRHRAPRKKLPPSHLVLPFFGRRGRRDSYDSSFSRQYVPRLSRLAMCRSIFVRHPSALPAWASVLSFPRARAPSVRGLPPAGRP